jgi:hypothetical protein
MIRFLRAFLALAVVLAAPASAQMAFPRGSIGPVILCQSGAAQAHTGDTNEFTAATCTIPAGALGANGRVEVDALFSYTNSANAKTLKVKFGGTIFHQAAPTTTATDRVLTFTANRNTTNSQVGPAPGLSSGTSTGTAVTASVDTTAAVDITITEQLALNTETVTLESYSVRLYPKS